MSDGDKGIARRVADGLRAEVDLLGETGRLLFLRMTLVQNSATIAASTATLRKAPEAR